MANTTDEPLVRDHQKARARQPDGPFNPRTSLAFIVHSSDTLTNNLPPNVDNKTLARQKRRRTSPEDQEILETEYKKNPKPDKAQRMAIVEQVALGEKEVQIWFQNRRQASRRKSRPLEPHEWAHYQSMKAMNNASSTPVRSGHAGLVPGDGQSEEPASKLQLVTPSASDKRPGDLPSSLSKSLRSHLSPSGYLADLRNEAQRSSQGAILSSPATTTSISPSNLPHKYLRRTSSSVRLSMSSDGVAKIVTKDDSSPSPPRKRPSPPPENADETRIKGTSALKETTTSSLVRKPSGRSRDSRAWEFWADKDARSELEEKAHQEASGSAADAIGLIRSLSGRNALGALPNKRGPTHDGGQTSKRTKRTALLQRSQSMQNRQPNWRSPTSSSPHKFRKAQSGLGIQIISADSDKENWSPERMLSHNESPISLSGSEAEHPRSTITPGKTLLAGLDRSAGLGSDSEDNDDSEVEEFMQRSRHGKSNSVSEEEELDCVQGLLSLSQGNWSR